MSPVDSVASLRDALSSPDAYPHNPDVVSLEQTHISIVAIVPPWVYKVKKPVDLGFLDFSTLEKRRAYCEKEVDLNQRLCADTYLGVVPVVDGPDGLRVDPDTDTGNVVEYAVKMKYLDPSFFLDERVKKGQVTASDIDRVARTLCSFYQNQSSSPSVARQGWIENIRVSTDENFEQTAEHVGDVFTRPTYDALRYFTDRFFDQNAALFHRRRAGGHVVDGHGDLRLEHVHLTEEHVCIYDCIEFNERFRHLDVANDVAFLAMDLDVHDRTDLARRLVRTVAHHLEDDELQSLIDFYKCYRAYVRGKVESMQAAEEEIPARDRARSRTRASSYYQWALRYALAGSRPLTIVIFGRSGTGKSTQASELARALGWAHLSSDRIRKTRAGIPLNEHPDDQTKDRLYSTEMSNCTYETLKRRALQRAQNNRGTVLDATYSSRKRRADLRSALQTADLPYVFVELTAPDDVLRSRLADRDVDSAMASDARPEDFEFLNDRYEAPTALEDARHVRVDTNADPEATTVSVMKALIRLTHEG